MSQRWLFFLLAILVGITGGLFYGWVINPVTYIDTTPDTLRVDFKSDYTLMVAEVFQYEGDVSRAAQRLALLGNTPPLELVDEARRFALQVGYSQADLKLLENLSSALQPWIGGGSEP